MRERCFPRRLRSIFPAASALRLPCNYLLQGNLFQATEPGAGRARAQGPARGRQRRGAGEWEGAARREGLGGAGWAEGGREEGPGGRSHMRGQMGSGPALRLSCSGPTRTGLRSVRVRSDPRRPRRPPPGSGPDQCARKRPSGGGRRKPAAAHARAHTHTHTCMDIYIYGSLRRRHGMCRADTSARQTGKGRSQQSRTASPPGPRMPLNPQRVSPSAPPPVLPLGLFVWLECCTP